MKGKWAAGIPPRNLTLGVIKDHLALSERPGGFSLNHRRVRRQEEIIWLRVQASGRVISLLPSPHNLAAYEEEGLAWAHYPLERTGDPRPVLAACFQERRRLAPPPAAHSSCIKTSWATGSWASSPATWCGRGASPPSPRPWRWVEHVCGHAIGAPGRELLGEMGGACSPATARRDGPPHLTEGPE